MTNASYSNELLKIVITAVLDGCVPFVPDTPSDSQVLIYTYHAADVFLLSSCQVPLGIVILVAWPARLPVLASNVGRLPGFVDDGVDGLLFNPRDDVSFDKYRSKACSEFDGDVITHKLLHNYKEVIHENPLRK